MRSTLEWYATQRVLSFWVVLTMTAAWTSHPNCAAAQTEGEYLYNVTLIRAAPGHFTDLIETLRSSFDLSQEAGDFRPFWIRHSQGDHWDFMLIYPIGRASNYYSANRVRVRKEALESVEGQSIMNDLERFTSFREEWLARSVELDEMRERFAEMDFYHIEMFAGLPGKRTKLIEQRQMENRYYEHLNRQQNMIFVREGGLNWDVMTIGFYESLQTYSEASIQYSEQEQDAAAKAAGFMGVSDISPYLRSLISYHNDTLGVRAE